MAVSGLFGQAFGWPAHQGHLLARLLELFDVSCQLQLTFWSSNLNDLIVFPQQLVGWLCWGLTSQSTIFQSCRDGAIASWVINQYFRGVKCLAQGHNTAAVGLEPRTSRSGVRHSTTEPPRSPSPADYELYLVIFVLWIQLDTDMFIQLWSWQLWLWYTVCFAVVLCMIMTTFAATIHTKLQLILNKHSPSWPYICQS